jgi:hypothetical protein
MEVRSLFNQCQSIVINSLDNHCFTRYIASDQFATLIAGLNGLTIPIGNGGSTHPLVAAALPRSSTTDAQVTIGVGAQRYGMEGESQVPELVWDRPNQSNQNNLRAIARNAIAPAPTPVSSPTTISLPPPRSTMIAFSPLPMTEATINDLPFQPTLLCRQITSERPCISGDARTVIVDHPQGKAELNNNTMMNDDPSNLVLPFVPAPPTTFITPTIDTVSPQEDANDPISVTSSSSLSHPHMPQIIPSSALRAADELLLSLRRKNALLPINQRSPLANNHSLISSSLRPFFQPANLMPRSQSHLPHSV